MSHHLQVTVSVDFVGPIKCRISAKTEGKAYLVLFACCLTRGLSGLSIVLRNRQVPDLFERLHGKMMLPKFDLF